MIFLSQEPPPPHPGLHASPDWFSTHRSPSSLPRSQILASPPLFQPLPAPAPLTAGAPTPPVVSLSKARLPALTSALGNYFFNSHIIYDFQALIYTSS